MPDWDMAAAVAAAFVVGTLLKGVTGLGLPPVVLPVLTPLVGVEHAVAVLAPPTLLGNGLLVWRNRAARDENPRLPVLAIGAATGGVLGTFVLTSVDERWLAFTLVGVVVAMLVLRIQRPHWQVSEPVARAGAAPVGLATGALQGATGLSAAVAGTWSTSLGLSRDGFVLTTALMLELAALSQVTTLLGLGALSGSRLWQAGLGCLVVAIMLPVGQHLGRKVQKAWFDRLVLVVLLGSATALLVEAL